MDATSMKRMVTLLLLTAVTAAMFTISTVLAKSDHSESKDWSWCHLAPDLCGGGGSDGGQGGGGGSDGGQGQWPAQ